MIFDQVSDISGFVWKIILGWQVGLLELQSSLLIRASQVVPFHHALLDPIVTSINTNDHPV